MSNKQMLESFVQRSDWQSIIEFVQRLTNDEVLADLRRLINCDIRLDLLSPAGVLSHAEMAIMKYEARGIN